MTSDRCYCVCHGPASSRAYCEHCKGDNSVGQYHAAKWLREHNVYTDAVLDGMVTASLSFVEAVRQCQEIETNR